MTTPKIKPCNRRVTKQELDEQLLHNYKELYFLTLAERDELKKQFESQIIRVFIENKHVWTEVEGNTVKLINLEFERLHEDVSNSDCPAWATYYLETDTNNKEYYKELEYYSETMRKNYERAVPEIQRLEKENEKLRETLKRFEVLKDNYPSLIEE